MDDRARPTDPTAAWDDARRVEAWAGELRVNLMRAGAVAAFYGHHLLRMYVLAGVRPGDAFHQAVSLVAATWVVLVLGMHAALTRRTMPGWLKYVSALGDVALVTLLLLVTAGPQSPLAVIYFVVVASTTLRLSLKLVWTVTAAAELGYLFVVAFVIRYRPALRIAHADQVVFMLALLCAGLFAGQSVRQARRLIRGSPVRVED